MVVLGDARGACLNPLCLYERCEVVLAHQLERELLNMKQVSGGPKQAAGRLWPNDRAIQRVDHVRRSRPRAGLREVLISVLILSHRPRFRLT